VEWGGRASRSGIDIIRVVRDFVRVIRVNVDASAENISTEDARTLKKLSALYIRKGCTVQV